MADGWGEIWLPNGEKKLDDRNMTFCGGKNQRSPTNLILNQVSDGHRRCRSNDRNLCIEIHSTHSNDLATTSERT